MLKFFCEQDHLKGRRKRAIAPEDWTFPFSFKLIFPKISLLRLNHFFSDESGECEGSSPFDLRTFLLAFT
jgi:hypothetical protein